MTKKDINTIIKLKPKSKEVTFFAEISDFGLVEMTYFKDGSIDFQDTSSIYFYDSKKNTLDSLIAKLKTECEESAGDYEGMNETSERYIFEVTCKMVTKITSKKIISTEVVT